MVQLQYKYQFPLLLHDFSIMMLHEVTWLSGSGMFPIMVHHNHQFLLQFWDSSCRQSISFLIHVTWTLLPDAKILELWCGEFCLITLLCVHSLVNNSHPFRQYVELAVNTLLKKMSSSLSRTISFLSILEVSPIYYSFFHTFTSISKITPMLTYGELLLLPLRTFSTMH